MEQFMRSLGTRYVQYFNKRHEKRVGSLFQDTYKAVLVETDEQLLHLSRYIHRNPLPDFQKGLSLKESPRPSSYVNYLGTINQKWVKPDEVLRYFAKAGFNSYENFVESRGIDEYSTSLIYNMSVDEM